MVKLLGDCRLQIEYPLYFMLLCKICMKIINGFFHSHFFFNVYFFSNNILNSLRFILIDCNIFWISFVLNVIFFLTSFSSCFSIRAWFFHFIMALALDYKRWGITLQTSYSSKRSQKNSYVMFLFLGYYNSTSSSIGPDSRAWGVCSLTIGWEIIFHPLFLWNNSNSWFCCCYRNHTSAKKVLNYF
jgi:hypothetical protein